MPTASGVFYNRNGGEKLPPFIRKTFKRQAAKPPRSNPNDSTKASLEIIGTSLLSFAMADGGADLDIGFDERSTQTLRVSALDIGAILVANEIFGEFHPVLLKQQYRGAASRAEKTFGTTASHKHSDLKRPGVGIFRFAVALDDITDHEGDDFDHGNPSDPRATRDVGVDYRHHSFVL